MNFNKEEFRSYVNKSLSEERKREIDDNLKDYTLEKKALQGAEEFEHSGSFDGLLEEIDTAIDSEISKYSEHSANTNSRIIPLFGKWIIAAAAIFLLFVMFRGNFQSEPYALSDYIDAYPDVITNVVRGTGQADNQSTLMNAMRAYQDGDYASTRDILEILKSDQDNLEIAFYLGVSYLHQGDFEKALEIFTVLTEPESRFSYEDGALWYRALCLIELDQKKEAEEILNQIASSNHYKKEEAREILKKI